MNARKYNVFVSVNAIASGRRSRTRDAIGADSTRLPRRRLRWVRGPRPRGSASRPAAARATSSTRPRIACICSGASPASITTRSNVCRSSLQRELQTDPAATPVTQNTRLPGFFNHKRAQPHLVTIEYRNVDVRYRPDDFPPLKETDSQDSSDRTARASGIRFANHRASEAVPAPPCRRRLPVSTATSTRFASAAGSREGSRSMTNRRCTCCLTGTRDASHHGPRPSCSTSSTGRLDTGVNQSEDCCSVLECSLRLCGAFT